MPEVVIITGVSACGELGISSVPAVNEGQNVDAPSSRVTHLIDVL